MKNNKFFISGMLAVLLTFVFALAGCPTGGGGGGGGEDGGGGSGGGGGAPIFTLTNISITQQNEGSNWFVFGLFPTGTSSTTVLADAKAHRNNTQPSAVIAYAGGASNTLSWQGTPGSGPISISGTLTTTTGATWSGSGTYDAWVLTFNGSVWNGYKKAAVNVQGNVSADASTFSHEIDDQS
jgi:hypothetical protein